MTKDSTKIPPNNQSPGFIYQYKTMSVDHLRELQADIDRLDREGKLSDNEIYRQYLNDETFEIPGNLANAQSIIVTAVFTRLMVVNFHMDGKHHEVMLPPQYYDAGVSDDDLRHTIGKQIIKDGYSIEGVKRGYLKLLAVRSGLGRYGRNNLCYVEGMGSFLTLYAYFTDYQFQEDHWTEMRIVDACKDCRICISHCPSHCISEENFVIDAGKCLTLYNEIQGEFPGWVSPDAHNALMGCMKCQLHCPANGDVLKFTERLEDITEEETKMILAGIPDDSLLKSAAKKLRRNVHPPESKLPVLTRNLRVLIG